MADTATIDELEGSDVGHEGDEGGNEEHRLARLLIGGRLRRRRLRRLLLAHLLHNKMEERTYGFHWKICISLLWEH